MNSDRAKEIFESLGYVNVVHKNEPVYIESLNEAESTAKVKNLNTDEIRQVPVDELVEVHTKL